MQGKLLAETVELAAEVPENWRDHWDNSPEGTQMVIRCNKEGVSTSVHLLLPDGERVGLPHEILGSPWNPNGPI